MYLLSRYVHIVCATLIVGGTLFYEMVVPIAIGDLKEEAKLAVFARARWVFRWIVWVSAVGIIVSGLITTTRQLKVYYEAERQAMVATSPENGRIQMVNSSPLPIGMRPGWWWAAHASAGVIAALIAVSLTAGRQPPLHPIRWMRLDMVVLLIVIFLAVATRQIAVGAEERAFLPDWRAEAEEPYPAMGPIRVSGPSAGPAAPATTPTTNRVRVGNVDP
jgi:hypothetical protein